MVVRFRKLADKTSSSRVVKFDPDTGAKKLVNPATSGEEHEPWPLAGVEFVDGIPDQMTLPTKYVQQAVSEGWMKRIGQRAVVRPAGPTMDEFESSYNGMPHTFIHCDEIHIKTVNGYVRYHVQHQPDKYVDNDNPEDMVTPELYEIGKTRVDHFYVLERIDG